MNETTGCKRTAILTAARQLIAEQGFHGTPTAMIAKQAGVGAGTIYRYFENKDELICAIHAELEAKLRAHMDEGYDRSLGVRERFVHLMKRLLRYLLENHTDFRFLEQFYNSPFGAGLRRDRLLATGSVCGQGEDDKLRGVIEAGQRLGTVKSLPLLVLHALAIGPIVFLVKDVNAGLISLDDALIEACIAGCWSAIAA